MTTKKALLLLALLAGCATQRYQDKKMDFGAIKTVAVLPLSNLSRDNLAGERVRDVYSNLLLATGAVYVLPAGEVTRGIVRGNVQSPATPSQEEVVNLGKLLQADALIAGTLKEYGEVRSGNSSANAISLSLQMFETQTGKVVWAASSTQGGISFWDRLLGGGGEPMNKVTEDAVRDLLRKLFK
jgi:polysaccharide biosynthesis protein PelC